VIGGENNTLQMENDMRNSVCELFTGARIMKIRTVYSETENFPLSETGGDTPGQILDKRIENAMTGGAPFESIRITLEADELAALRKVGSGASKRK
jgi:hypothetical protein